MAYVVPTVEAFKVRYPRFAAVADATLQVFLDETARTVDESWMEGDYTRGRMLLAAHNLVTEGLGTGAEAESAAAGASGFKVMRSASLTLERFDNKSASGWAGMYAGTSYGIAFAALQAINVGGPRVTNTGTICGYPGRFPHGEE